MVFTLIAIVIGAAAGLGAAFWTGAQSVAEGARAGVAVGRYLSPALPIIVTILLIVPRRPNLVNILLALAAMAIGLFYGWFVAGLLLAILTTQPTKTGKA